MAEIQGPTIENAMQMASQAQIDSAYAMSVVAELRRDFHPELSLKQAEKTIHMAMILSKLLRDLTSVTTHAREQLLSISGESKPKEDF